MYGAGITRRKILDGKVAVPPSAQPLLRQLGGYIQ